MDLIIEIDNIKLNLTEFCNWLIGKMQEYIIREIDNRQLERFDLYLNKHNSIIYIGSNKRKYTSKEILIGSTYNLRTQKFSDKYIINIDPNVNIPNTYVKFIDIVKLINYGNIYLNPYPIYTKMMNYFADNILEYYDEFIKETI